MKRSCYGAKEVIKWINKNLPPLTWNIVRLQVNKFFISNGVNLDHLDEDDVLCDEFIDQINFVLASRCNVNIPNSLKKNM